MKYNSVSDYTQNLLKNGFYKFTVKEGVLNDTELYVHPETIKAVQAGERNPKFLVLVTPHFLNEWQNCFTIRKFRKIPEKYEKFIIE